MSSTLASNGTAAAAAATGAAADADALTPPSRRMRFRLAAEARGVPVLTIFVAVAVVGGVYLLALLAYRIRTVLLLIAIAAFLALCLNPFVVLMQRRLRRRALAVGAVVVIGLIVFLGLAAAFGLPLSNGLAHLAKRLPSDVAAAQHGGGPMGPVIRRFHLEKWVATNAPKLQQLGTSLAKPALSFGKAAAAAVGEMLAIVTLVVLLLLEGPRMRRTLLTFLSPEHAAWSERVGTEMRQAVVGYVFGDLLTSLIAGVVVGVTMWALGLPFPVLWGVWVALVDFLPQVGGALAGIPTILFALTQSVSDAAILAGVFVAYQEVENHVLNPVVMSKTVKTSPLLIFVSVLVGAAIGAVIAGPFGAFCSALFAVPTAACLQILVREVWQLTATSGAESSSSPVGADTAP